MAERHLYRGSFNYAHELVVKYVYAYSGRQAKVLMMRRLAKEHQVHPGHIFALFDGSRDNFIIEKEPKCFNPRPRAGSDGRPLE